MASLLIEQRQMCIERGSAIDYDWRYEGIDSLLFAINIDDCIFVISFNDFAGGVDQVGSERWW
jgi:hypothetical protein